MLPNIIIVCGINRSGSTWTYQICKELLESHSMLDLGYVKYDQLEEIIDNVEFSDYEHVLLKMHVHSEYIKGLRSKYRIYFIYTHRDIRACIYSIMKKTKKRFDEVQAMPFIDRGIMSYSTWLSYNNVLKLSYNEIIGTGDQCVKKVMEFLNVNADYSKISLKYSLPEQKKRISRYKSSPIGLFKSALTKLRIRPSGMDPNSLLHLNHINSNSPDEWKEHLTVRQSEYVVKKYEEWYATLEYFS